MNNIKNMMMEDLMESRLRPFVMNGYDAVEMKMIRTPKDIDDNSIGFKAEMCHQVFGENETIFGYKDLVVKLYYAAGCLETYLAMTYSEQVNKSLSYDVEPDSVLPQVIPLLDPNVHENIDTFIKALEKDKTFRPAGELIYSISVEDKKTNKKRDFEVYKGDMTNQNFKEHHIRLRTFLLWYIDGACFVDLDDDAWHFFNIFERYTTEDNSIRYATAGFTTVYQYYAYPCNTRPRIAQILILPPFQKMGLGAHLLQAVYREYKKSDMVKDITVEDPSEGFQRLRDYVDAKNCSTLPSFSRENLRNGFSKTMVAEALKHFKINRVQVRRVYEILRLKETDLSDEEDYRKYRLNVKSRINAPYKREQNEAKRVRAALGEKSLETTLLAKLAEMQEQRYQLLEKAYRELELEYERVVKRLQRDNL